ncbi:hypothetical protein [Nocardia sp. NPDC050175]|uniref:hypothetical protein n=1 Tax=Nocardia sp. NPDC050175 TaxID=3364317 RepID=UPI003795FAE4
MTVSELRSTTAHTTPVLVEVTVAFGDVPVRAQAVGPGGFATTFAAERLDRILAGVTAGEVRPRWPDPRRPQPAPYLSEHEAADRLCRYGLPFLFYPDPRDRRGRLFCRRYDGDLALIEPTDSVERER